MVLLATVPLALLMAMPTAQAPAPEQAEVDTDQPAPAAEQAPPVVEAPTQPDTPPAPSLKNPDPLERMNRAFFILSEPFDRFILRPAAILYRTLIPAPVRDGIRNVIANLFTPTIFINDVLQLRPDRAATTLQRLVINSTMGIGGVFDLARRQPFNAPGHPNGFADTLGYWGVHPGPYIYVPIMGPNSLRELVGMAGDAFSDPLLLNHIYPSARAAKSTTPPHQRFFLVRSLSISKPGAVTILASGIDMRERADAGLQALKAQSVDLYASLRASYLQSRAGEIAMLKAKDGAPVEVPAFDDPLTDPAATHAKGPPVSSGAPAATGAH